MGESSGHPMSCMPTATTCKMISSIHRKKFVTWHNAIWSNFGSQCIFKCHHQKSFFFNQIPKRANQTFYFKSLDAFGVESLSKGVEDLTGPVPKTSLIFCEGIVFCYLAFGTFHSISSASSMHNSN